MLLAEPGHDLERSARSSTLMGLLILTSPPRAASILQKQLPSPYIGRVSGQGKG